MPFAFRQTGRSVPPTPAGRAAPAEPPVSAYLHLLIVYLVWGSSYLAIKLCVSGPTAWAPLQLQTARMWCAALALGAISLFLHGAPQRLSLRDLGLCAVTGVLMWVGGNGLSTFSAQHASSGFIVMAMGAIPLWTVLLSALLERRRPGAVPLAALGIGLFGLGLVFLPEMLGDARSSIDPALRTAVLLALVGAGLSWSLGTILQKPLGTRLPPSWAATWQMLAASLALTGLAAWNGVTVPVAASPVQIGAFAFLVILASVVCLMSYLIVVRSFAPQISSTFAYVNPVVGLVLSWLVLDERAAPLSLLGILVIIGSVAALLALQNRR